MPLLLMLVLPFIAFTCPPLPAFATDGEAETELMEAIHAEMESDTGEKEKPKKSAKKAMKKSEKKAEEKKAEEKKAEEKKADAKDEKKNAKKSEAKKEDANKEEKLGELDCPRRLSVAEQKLDKKLPAGYGAFTEAQDSYWLKTVYVYSGDKQLERVEPYKSTESTAEYMLTDNGKVSYSLVCAYGDTALKVKKPLGKALTQCSLGTAENPANPAGPRLLIALSCH